jgi:hypothetical protein
MLFGATVCLVFLAGCRNMMGVRGSGIEKTETREVAAFEEIELRGAGTMDVVVGSSDPLTITTDDNLLPLIDTRVEDGLLVIAPSESINPQTPPVISLGAPRLVRIRVSGAATLNVIDVRGGEFTVDVSGAARVVAKGQVETFTLELSGAGEVDATELAAQRVVANLSGVGGADVHAVKSLKATISGLGVIRYQGDPAVEKEISGAGAIKRLE